MEIGITGVQGSHPNFLAYVLNVLYNDSQIINLPNDQTFDQIKYPTKNFERKYFPEHWSLTNPIRIIVDNELLWMHQYLCRCTGHFNLNILYLEENLFDFQKSFYEHSITVEKQLHLMTHPIMSIFGDFSRVAMKKYSKNKKKLLDHMYKERIFDKFLPEHFKQSVFLNPPKDVYLFPMTDFYDWQKFDAHILKLMPNRSLGHCKKLHDQFMSNIIHTPENIHQNGSILVESWQEYLVDRSP